MIHSKLRAHWPLQKDAHNITEHSLVSMARGLEFREVDGRPAAVFNGRDSALEIADHPALRLGAGDFTISLRLHTAASAEGGDIVGDLISKFDATRRKGFNLVVNTQSGVTQTTQPNYRHLQFGIDEDDAAPGWTDCGRPGEAVKVSALATIEGSLYAGTFENARPDSQGHLMRYESDGAWQDLGATPDGANCVGAVTYFDGSIFCSTGRYDARGSAMPQSLNPTPGGHVYRIVGDGQWEDCGHPGLEGAAPDDAANSYGSSDQADETAYLTVYRGHLYAVSNHRRGLYRYEGGKSWQWVGPDIRIMSVTVHQGRLYALANGVGCGVAVYEDDGTWTSCGVPTGSLQTYCAVTHRGQLLVGTWPECEVVRYDGGQAWSVLARGGYERELMAVALYNGKCYFGSLPMANVFRFDESTMMTFFGNLDNDPTVHLRRAWSMAIYQGELFAGTLPQGRVLRRRVGAVATHDHTLPSGWHQIVAQREADRLRLFLDGIQIAEASRGTGKSLDLDNQEPLRIGHGIGHALNGALADVRLYKGALDPAQIA